MDGKTMSMDLESQPFTKEGFVKFRQLFKALVAAVALLGFLFILCAALLIWVATVATDNQDKLESKDLRLAGSIPNGDMSSVSPVFQGTGYWSLRTALPFKRSDHQVAVVDDLVYIVGGQDATGNATDDITIYDPVLNTFSKGPKMRVTLTRFVLVFVPDKGEQGKLYLIGGMEIADQEPSGKVHILDIKTKKWSLGPEMKTPRSDFCGAYVDGKIYVAGGWPINFTETLGSVEVLDLATGEWTEGVDMPTPRGDCKAAALDDEFVVVGGYYDEENQWRSDKFRDEVEAFNPGTGKWTSLAALPNARGDKAVIALPGNRLLAIGGETDSRGERTEVATHFVEEYISEHDIWVEKAPLLFSKFRTAAAYVDGAVFLFGGHAICVFDEDGQSKDCPETDEVQAFFDIDHPDAFLIKEN